MLGRWIRKALNETDSRVSAARPDLKAQIHNFATAVKAIATDESRTHDQLVEQLCALADAVLKQETPSRAPAGSPMAGANTRSRSALTTVLWVPRRLEPAPGDGDPQRAVRLAGDPRVDARCTGTRTAPVEFPLGTATSRYSVHILFGDVTPLRPPRH